MSAPNLLCMLNPRFSVLYSSLTVRFKWPPTEIRSRPYASGESRHASWRVLFQSHLLLLLLLLYFPFDLTHSNLVFIFCPLQSRLCFHSTTSCALPSELLNQCPWWGPQWLRNIQYSWPDQLPPTHLAILNFLISSFCCTINQNLPALSALAT